MHQWVEVLDTDTLSFWPLVLSRFTSFFISQVWSQYLYRWVPTDNNARKFPLTEQPSLNPGACWVCSNIKHSIINLLTQLTSLSNTRIKRIVQTLTLKLILKCKLCLFYLIMQVGPPISDFCLSLPHARWRWPVSTEASLHLHSQCSYGQHSGRCWCQHYRGQCWCFDLQPPGQKESSAGTCQKPNWLLGTNYISKSIPSTPQVKMAVFRADVSMPTTLVQIWPLLLNILFMIS